MEIDLASVETPEYVSICTKAFALCNQDERRRQHNYFDGLFPDPQPRLDMLRDLSFPNPHPGW